MNHPQASDGAKDATRIGRPATHDRVQRRTPSRPLDTNSEKLYQVSLTAADLQLIQACSRWICRLGPAPDVRARLVRLEQQVAGAALVR